MGISSIYFKWQEKLTYEAMDPMVPENCKELHFAKPEDTSVCGCNCEQIYQSPGAFSVHSNVVPMTRSSCFGSKVDLIWNPKNSVVQMGNHTNRLSPRPAGFGKADTWALQSPEMNPANGGGSVSWPKQSN